MPQEHPHWVTTTAETIGRCKESSHAMGHACTSSQEAIARSRDLLGRTVPKSLNGRDDESRG